MRSAASWKQTPSAPPRAGVGDKGGIELVGTKIGREHARLAPRRTDYRRDGEIFCLVEQKRRQVLGGRLRHAEGRADRRHHPGRPHLFTLGGAGGQGGGAVLLLQTI